MTDRLIATFDRLGERRLLLVIALVALIAELAFLRPPTQYGEPYLIAKNIAAGKGYVFVYPLTGRELPTCYATPLYTYLQVPFLVSGLGERGIQLLNILLLQLGALAVYRFFRRLVTPILATACYAAVSFFVPFWILAYSLEPNALNLLLLVVQPVTAALVDLARTRKHPGRNVVLSVALSMVGLLLVAGGDLATGAHDEADDLGDGLVVRGRDHLIDLDGGVEGAGERRILDQLSFAGIKVLDPNATLNVIKSPYPNSLRSDRECSSLGINH